MQNSQILLETRLVSDIKGTFYVPSYQRGYRWGEDEVLRLVCKRAVTKPDNIPDSIAAGSARKGWPASVTTAPTAAPMVNAPSVDRSQTFSMV